tara:strand:- start:127 stop:699 length:573 start_codon:yes stop_codon:yes gene_type:complete
MPLTQLKARLLSFLRCDFARKEDGVIAIEAVIIMPMIFWTFLSMFSIFDSFRMYSINQKAAYTIGDAVSRETLPIDDDYLNGALNLFEYLSKGQGNTAIRISSVRYNATDNRFYRDWSETRGWVQPLTSSDVRTWTDRLPLMIHNERLVLVETWNRYEPPFKTGLELREIKNFVFTRPRYAPRVCWEQCN